MSQSAELWIKASHRLGESIIWHGQNRCLYWVDLLDPALFIHEPTTGETRNRALPLPPPIGSIAETTDPNLLILAHRGGLSLLDLRSMALAFYCDPEGGRDAIIYNDIKTDRWGRLWVGTSHEKEQLPRGALWCVESRNRWALVDAGFAISNGPAFSRDGRTMYFNDSLGRTTFAYEIDETLPAARNRRIFVEHADGDGLPDGVTVDAEDYIWTAQWGGAALLRFDRNGKKVDRISVAAANVTTLAFSGADLKTINITTAIDGLTAEQKNAYPLNGCLFHCSGQAAGLAETPYRL